MAAHIFDEDGPSSSEEFEVSVEVEVPVGEGGLKARKSGIGIIESGRPGGPLISPTSGKNLAKTETKHFNSRAE